MEGAGGENGGGAGNGRRTGRSPYIYRRGAEGGKARACGVPLLYIIYAPPARLRAKGRGAGGARGHAKNALPQNLPKSEQSVKTGGGKRRVIFRKV